jgi:intracellular sulfur oxidation DsrE/DsrF family protein
MAHHEPSRRRTLAALAVWVAAPRLVSAQGNEAPRGLRAVIQVSDNDPQKWHLALNNARNALDELGTREAIELEIVVYGPGIGMLKMDSTVANRVAEALAAGVHVVACENTMRAQKLTQADMLPRIGYVPAGVVELMKRQQQGWAYLRP